MLETSTATGLKPRTAAWGQRVQADARRPMVAPLARALAVCGAFTPEDRWLGNRELAQRTDLPASTVSRIAQSLVAAGYLLHDPLQRKYRLAPAVLGLGYAAIANSDALRRARVQMQAFADRHQVQVCMGSRDRLDLVVLEACGGPGMWPGEGLQVGARAPMASSLLGCTLLGALPEQERYYLMAGIERRSPREGPQLRRRVGEAVAQVYERGFSSSPAEGTRGRVVVAVPVLVDGQEPWVLACAAAPAQMGRQRVERELGPRLLALARALRDAGAAS